MSAIEIKKVETRSELDDFIEFHYDLYKDNPYDVPNLYSDEVKNFSKDKNPAFEFSDAECYLALRDGKVVGRVAAIISTSSTTTKCPRLSSRRLRTTAAPTA